MAGEPVAIAVIAINGALAVLCLVVAFYAWQLRRVLQEVTRSLTIAERATHGLLGNAPEGVLIGQGGVAWLRDVLQEQGEQMAPAIARLQQSLTLMVWVTNRWSRLRQSSQRRRSSRR
ncbi:MAG: DUF948 domain-containing protein [Cyanobacteria bacterium P01_H01_bin.130]